MDDESLFAMHARFKTGEDVPEGWYRAGEVMGEGSWVVDIDLFVEIELPAAEWVSLRGETMELVIGDDTFEVEVPEDVDFDEIWTLEGCGLFEPAPGVTEEQLAEAEDLDTDDELGRFGDLHIVPLEA